MKKPSPQKERRIIKAVKNKDIATIKELAPLLSSSFIDYLIDQSYCQEKEIINELLKYTTSDQSTKLKDVILGGDLELVKLLLPVAHVDIMALSLAIKEQQTIEIFKIIIHHWNPNENNYDAINCAVFYKNVDASALLVSLITIDNLEKCLENNIYDIKVEKEILVKQIIISEIERRTLLSELSALQANPIPQAQRRM